MPNADAVTDIADLERSHCEQLADKISTLASYVYAAEQRLLTLIREFDEREGWKYLGFHSCACWLNFKCGMDMNTARERLRVAHALGRLPKIDARFAEGAISYSKVRAMTRIADANNEDYLLMIAKHGTAYHVETLVRKYRRAKRLQDAEQARAQHDHRQLRHYHDDDGSLVIKGRFPPEQGALILKALAMAMERDVADVSAATSALDEPVAVRRADALAAVAESYMNSEPVPNSTADRYQVVVHVAAATPAAAAYFDKGPHVSAETSRRVACDCSLLRVNEDESGEPLSVGRKTRSIPPALRRALHLRDGGCRFPGCTHERFVDGHHVKHWADGGETSLDNLLLLCRHHHRLVHEGGFICEKTAEGEVVFTDQRQQPLPPWSPLPGIDDEDIDAWLDREFFDRGIDAGTCRSQWYAGERMDWDLAVANLFQ
jgi:Domain of unknown function (DUF222)/HNH endonuclease